MNRDPDFQEQDYLHRCWELLAAIAWKEFSARGRGAVVAYLAEPNDSARFIYWKCWQRMRRRQSTRGWCVNTIRGGK